jgi:hypothetical protein
MRTTRLFRWGRMVPLPHDRTHKQGWNHALEAMEDALRDDLAKGQLVSREDVIRGVTLGYLGVRARLSVLSSSRFLA